MSINRLLVANRGEVAVRVMRTASEMGITTVAVFSSDDAASLHVRLADEAHALDGSGAVPYLDIAGVIAAATAHHCDAIHPGWGFLSENAEFARRCAEAGIIFVGPDAETLAAFGDKTRAREIAAECGVPTMKGTGSPLSLDGAKAFFEALGDGASMVLKAVAGGGGRGMRVINALEEIDSAYARCQSEALRAFGNGDLYAEQRMRRARHIEVQVVGDGATVSHIGERDCSVQRRHQKVVEIAPAPHLPAGLRARLLDDSLRMAAKLDYRGLGTFEFLVDADAIAGADATHAFIEANARLQVEHTITEEVFGFDLVRAQLLIAGGQSLADVGLDQASIPAPRGWAMQLRVNMEQIDATGMVRPSTGTLGVFLPPSGPGVRVDTFGYQGYATSPMFDSLLAKLVVHNPSPDFGGLIARAERAVAEFAVEGVSTNLGFLANLLRHDDLRAGRLYTTFVDEHIAELAVPAALQEPQLPAVSGHSAGARVDATDPLAVLAYGKREVASRVGAQAVGNAPHGAVLAPMQSTVVSFEVAIGDSVRAGQEVAVLNAMKMEHVLKATATGTVRRINAAPGDTVSIGQLLLQIESTDASEADVQANARVANDDIRPDLAEVLARHEKTLDAARPEAIDRRHGTGNRTARENIEALIDEGTFVEWGPLVVAADSRFSLQQLIDKSPADGMITGVASINGHLFSEPASQVAIIAYDYTVFAGTQGGRSHAKTDRMIDVAERGRMPVVLFAEGGGGRASGGDGGARAGGPGSTTTFAHFAQLSGLVPIVGITAGRCFAGNASLLGCCDVIIATADSNIGMGGPAMIEGGGLGVFAPEEIGPVEVQIPNGVIDIAVADEVEAVAVAKRYLSYFQGQLTDWEAPDQRLLRQVIPELRLRAYDVREVIETMCDIDSVLELRAGFGQTMITSLGRIEGRPVGIIANNPMEVGGAITSDGADKASRFMQLCDAFDIPLLFLCDTPGIMVGPETEKTAIVRHANRMFVIGANVTVPCMTIVLRKAYGLGAIAMAAGTFRSPYFTISWPTGEFGGMGLEGQVKLGFRTELAAIEDPTERRELFDKMVGRAYQRGKALNEATNFGVDNTIDPAESRRWVATVLKSVRSEPRTTRKRAGIDAW